MNTNIRKAIFIPLIILFLGLLFPCFAQNPQTGMCSYYANNLQGRKTASGEPYNKSAFTAAHNTLPFHTWVIVTNLSNNKSVKVRINDRGPHTKSRIIDISQAAAQKIGLVQAGITKVKIEICPSDSLFENTTDSSIITTTSVKEEITIRTTVPKSDYQIGSFYDKDGKVLKPKGYYIQISSYSNFETFLINENEWVNNQKKAVYCEVAQSKSKKIYRLLIGAYTTKAEADKELSSLNKKGVKGLIKKY